MKKLGLSLTALFILCMCFRIEGYTSVPLRSFLRKASTQMMQQTNNDMKTFASYVVYKGKSAVSVKVIPPSYSSVGSKSRSVSRTGALLFEFAPVGATPREYDWTRKTSFSLSPTECGDVLVMDLAKGVEFFHDPNMGGSVSNRCFFFHTDP